VQAIEVKSAPAKGISGVTSGPKGGPGDEYISLTFLESSEDEEEEEEEAEVSGDDRDGDNVQMDERAQSSEVEDAMVEGIL
jgi:hypothetical protein